MGRRRFILVSVAAMANYVTGRFGSVASSATPQQVAMLRLQHQPWTQFGD
jgi:hypothetical protein